MQRTIRIVLAILLVATLATLIVPAVLSQGRGPGGRGGRMAAVDEMYDVVNVTGVTDASASFDILSMAVNSKDGRATVFTPSAPKPGVYYFANDTAVLPFGYKTRREHNRPVMTDYNNATVNVSGASAVLAWKNVTRTGTSREDYGMQSTGLAVYRPGGNGKSYQFSTPVRLAKSADNSSLLIVGNPELRAAMQDILNDSARFPAGTPPVKLKDVDAVK